MAADEKGRVSDAREEESAANGGCVAAECENCLSRFKLKRWRAGIKCPGCHDGKLTPLVAEGGAVDYCVADRSSGYAQQDIRFAQWLKWGGLITPRQYEEALRKQNRIIQQQKKDRLPPIHRVMVDEGWITEKQATDVLEFMSRHRPDTDDRHYADAVEKSGSASPEELRKSMEFQEKVSKKVNETPSLCQVMLEKHLLNEARTLSLLRKLQSSGRGPLKSLSEAVRGQKRIIKKKRWLREAVRTRSSGIKKTVLITVLVMVAAAVWYRQGYEPPYRFIAVCEHCEETNEMDWGGDFPLRCPTCGLSRAYPALICEEGHIFADKNPYIPSSCPECGSSDVRPLDED